MLIALSSSKSLSLETNFSRGVPESITAFGLILLLMIVFSTSFQKNFDPRNISLQRSFLPRVTILSETGVTQGKRDHVL